MNCRCRGASTLLTNLLHQRQPMNRYDEPWHAQYGKLLHTVTIAIINYPNVMILHD